MIICTKCSRMLPFSCFYKNKNNQHRQGYGHHCKECTSAYIKNRRESHPDKIKEVERRYRDTHKDILKKKSKIYRQARERTEEMIQAERIYDISYRDNNKERLKQVKNKWLEINKDRVVAYKKQYYQRNKDKILSKNSHKRMTDMGFHINCRTRTRLRTWLKGWKIYPDMDILIGKTAEEFKQWIESQFKEGMSWENRRRWHIDHYVPLKYFDPANPEDQRIAWNYRNLLPLWATDNFSKGSKLPDDYLEHIDKIKQALTLS